MNTPDRICPPTSVLKDITITAVADYLNTAPDRLKEPLELGQNGVDYVCFIFHQKFENRIHGFDRRMLFWYLDDITTINGLVSSVRNYMEELLRT